MDDLNPNPYSPPAAVLQPVLDDDLVYPKASKGKRLLNLLIDYAALMGIVFVTTLILVTLEEMGVVEGVTEWVDNDSSGPLDVVMLLLFVLYYVVLESLFGRTLGKLVTGTKVIATSGARPSFLSVLGRSCVRFVPFEAFSGLGQNLWHDVWSGTRVVDVRKPKVPKPAFALRKYQ